MSSVRASFFALSLSTAALAMGGCAGQTAPESAEPPPMPVLSAEGVTLHASSADRAAGRFERHGAAIRFDLRRAPGGARHVLLSRDTGEPLFESTLDHDVDTSSYLGGRLRTTGAVGEEPAKDGDASALDELTAMPESRAMIELKSALGAAGVPDDLLRAPVHPRGSITPQVYGAGGTTPYPDGRWYNLPSYQTIGFYSWGFWATTTIILQGVDDYYAVRFRVGSNFATEYQSGFGQKACYRQWWGAYADVTNVRVPLAGSSSSVWVLVK